jgi:hypothetical protein
MRQMSTLDSWFNSSAPSDSLAPGGAGGAQPLFYFEDAAAVQRLCSDAADARESARRSASILGCAWPHRRHDCIGCAKYLLVRAGAIANVQISRDTDADYENHAFGDRFLQWMRGETDNDVSRYLHERFAEIRMPDLREMNPVRWLVMPGDLIVLQHKQLVHLPIVLNDQLPFDIISALPRIGVKIGTLQDTTFRQHFKALFRARAIASPART